MLPTRARRPRDKGKVEKSVDYVQSNALKGRTFASLAEQNAWLGHWEETVADTRIHGTTRRQVGKALAAEREYLLPLPDSLFPCFKEAERKVHRDGHVEVDKAYYSVPAEYARATVWVRWDGRTVSVFDRHFRKVAVHAACEAGRFSTQKGHISARKIAGVEKGEDWTIGKLRLFGPATEAWGKAVLINRGVEGLRVLRGLLSMTGRHPSKTMDQFNWNFNPKLDRDRIENLACCQFIRDRRNVLFIGPPGTGKTHLAQGIGYNALRMGFLVLYRSIFDLVREFLRDEAMSGQEKMLDKYLKPDLLIVDDMGLKQLPKNTAEYLFEVVMRRYETRSTIMTSNRPIEEWGKLVGDVPAAGAILDRFLHHAEIIPVKGRTGRKEDWEKQLSDGVEKTS